MLRTHVGPARRLPARDLDPGLLGEASGSEHHFLRAIRKIDTFANGYPKESLLADEHVGVFELACLFD